MRWSVRTRATASTTAIVGATLIVAAVGAVGLRHRALLNDVDSRAQNRLDDVASLAKQGQLPTTLAGAPEDSTLAQVVAGGSVIAQSPQISARSLLARFEPSGNATSTRTVHRAPVTGGGSFRIAARRVMTSRGSVVVYAAAPLESATESVRALEFGLGVAVAALNLLIATATWWTVGRALRPVENIRRKVDEISDSELHRRVPEPATGDEIQRLAETMNTMLERLEHATLRQRSFVSDAAHELRSPIASIRAETEIAAAHPEVIDADAALTRISSTVHQMETLVEDLLVLATSDEQGRSRATDVDLDEIVVQQLETARATATARIDSPAIDAARIDGHRDHLRRVVANVLDNATRHAQFVVVVELRVRDSVAELTITDDGPGIPRELREYVFDRFARIDDARSRARGGAGLGLAIARTVVENHDGTIRIDDTPSGTRVVIRLPLQPTDPGCAA